MSNRNVPLRYSDLKSVTSFKRWIKKHLESSIYLDNEVPNSHVKVIINSLFSQEKVLDFKGISTVKWLLRFERLKNAADVLNDSEKEKRGPNE